MQNQPGQPEVNARKALLRGMGFSSGQYKIRGFAPDREFNETLDDDLKTLFLTIQQEAEIQSEYADLFPRNESKVVLVHPLEPRLSDSQRSLGHLQLALNYPRVGDVLIAVPATSNGSRFGLPHPIRIPQRHD